MVALLTEGVDRNVRYDFVKLFCQVALLTEGVDRNNPYPVGIGDRDASPSSRRAWIEILLYGCPYS